MKKIIAFLLMAMLFLACFLAENPEKYIPKSERKREKYATPEPGTYLKPMALSLLKKINRVLEDSSKLKEPAPWMKGIFTPKQKRLIDTVLIYQDIRVPVRIYYPTQKSMQGKHPVTMFLHGGGFMYCSVEHYHMVVSKLARVSGNIFVSVEYGLAPEHPFPEALMDCFAVLQWMQEHGSTIGADTSQITVMGDSAGGNLATVMTLLCRDHNLPQPARQVLIYPACCLNDSLSSSMTHFLLESDRNYVLSESFVRRVRQAYLGQEKNIGHPYFSPLEATLSGELAPALIIAAECDPLRDGSRLYAQKLEVAGVDVEYIEYSGMIHAFLTFFMVLDEAQEALKEIRDYLVNN